MEKVFIYAEVPKTLKKKIEKHVASTKRAGLSYSLKNFVIEALNEKLEKEEKKGKKERIIK